MDQSFVNQFGSRLVCRAVSPGNLVLMGLAIPHEKYFRLKSFEGRQVRALPNVGLPLDECIAHCSLAQYTMEISRPV